MRLALGMLKWDPNVFWKSTPHELVAALEGSQGEFGQTKRKADSFQRLYKAVKEADQNGDNS